MRMRLVATLGSVAVAAVVLATVPAAGQNAPQTTATYTVTLLQPPAAGYEGNVPGFARTKPARGQKYNSRSAAARRYAEYLEQQQSQLLDQVGAGDAVYHYTHSVNGFAAELTEGQAAKLAETEGVLSVEEAQLLEVDTSSTPEFLGLTKPAGQGGLWAKLGGTGPGVGRPGAGEDVIIGIVDTGYWPEHPSFSDRRGSQGQGGGQGQNLYPHPPTGWNGECQAGEEFPASTCNNKVIGARWFAAGIGPLPDWEYASPRDFSGHGTHVGSTAGGNHGITPTGEAAAFGPISGMAPRARLAFYKGCYVIVPGTSGSCSSLDTTAAIDAAVADGVDVLNYSISGTQTAFTNITQVAFLFAAEAGVYVSASAGNTSGVAPYGSVNHPSPWITTTAAAGHNRTGQGSATVGGTTYNGASLSPEQVSGVLIRGADAAAAGQSAANANLCFAAVDNAGVPVLDPAKVAGKIVLCDRGVTALVNKSLAVKTAGGIGVILTNVMGGATNTLALIHSVPTVHVPFTAGDYAALHAAAGAGANATIAKATLVFDVPAPTHASFSNRGPLAAGAGDILKPDLIAPGQDILAGVAPPGNQDRLFDLYSGTSMSSPHAAGLGALLKQAHPDWSPMMIKSAFMTTAYDIIDAFPGDATRSPDAQRTFTQGAGHVDPNKAVDPGLVFDSGFLEWIAFLEGQGLANGPLPPIDATDLNQASIAIGALAGSRTVKRSAKSVGSQSETYTFSVQGLPGITAVPSVNSFTAAPGSTTEWTVTFTRTTAPLNVYQAGFVVWTGNRGHVVRMPVVIRPVALAAPTEVSGNGGPISYDVTFGYDGPFSATPRGLVPADITEGTVQDDPTDGSCATLTTNEYLVPVPVTIPAGTTYARFSLFDADVAPGADIDLCVIRLSPAPIALVGISGSPTSAEEVNLLNPVAGEYRVVVHGWGVPEGGSPFKLHTWLLGTADEGNMAVDAPATATTGATGTINLTFSGLSPDTKYLGSVAYGGVAGLPNPTIVRVDTP